MKKLILACAVVITIALCFCCKTQQTLFDYVPTHKSPQWIVDSIANSYDMSLPDYHTWESDVYFTSDSIIVTSYYYVTHYNKRTYIFNIVSSPDSTIHLIKFRLE